LAASNTSFLDSFEAGTPEELTDGFRRLSIISSL